MWQERNPSPASPFDCAVCGACVDGKMSGVRTCLPCRSFFRRHAFLPPNTLRCNQNGTCDIEATRRYFAASLPPCRACRLQKCLAVGMDLAVLRPRSISTPPSKLIDRYFVSHLLKRSSFDESAVSTAETDFDQTCSMLGRVRCCSDASDWQRRFD